MEPSGRTTIHQSEPNQIQPSSSSNNIGNHVITQTQQPHPFEYQPGAYQVHTPQQATVPSQVYRVQIPANVRPHEEFTVRAGSQQVRVRVPPNTVAGQTLEITLPVETPQTQRIRLQPAPVTRHPSDTNVGGGLVRMTRAVQQINEQAQQEGGTPRTQMFTIPVGVRPGQYFALNTPALAGGAGTGEERLRVQCPSNAVAGMAVRLVLPPLRPVTFAEVVQAQVFEVVVPPGVQPNQKFTTQAAGQRVVLTCPATARAGQTVRFELAVSSSDNTTGAVMGAIKYKSESHWRRDLRALDLKFQWAYYSAENDKGKKQQSDKSILTEALQSTAYVRHVSFWEGNDVRMRTGMVEWVPASKVSMDSRLVGRRQQELFSHSKLLQLQNKSLAGKQQWLQESVFQSLQSPWEEGHIKICVRRKHLLHDSIVAMMSLGRDDLRKPWQVSFLSEPALDAKGLTKEWFALVSKQVFDPKYGLFCENDQARLDIHSGSGMCNPDDHLVTYRFVGRLLGRALMDRQLVQGQLTRVVYKQLLGFPVSFEDIRYQDEQYFQSLRLLADMGNDDEDVSVLCQDFTATEEVLGFRTSVDLISDGSQIPVTNENLSEYLQAVTKYRLFQRTQTQLAELLLGLLDIVPEEALVIFDGDDLEQMLCGQPSIDVDDWQSHTLYKSLYSHSGQDHKVVQWFWELVRDDFDLATRQKLLHFVTGAPGVPLAGFSDLRGANGDVHWFTVEGVDRTLFPLPLSHICFNRIDLPNYESKEELCDKLVLAVANAGEEFGFE